MVSSPKVATYDLKPEMSAAGIADAVVKAVEEGTFDMMVVNFANADMVGHSGKLEPTIKAVETVDACLGRIELAVRSKGGAMLITADHGNADDMLEDDGSPQTAHSMNPVPLIVTADVGELHEGILADVAPTILALLGRDQPDAMTGSPLQKT